MDWYLATEDAISETVGERLIGEAGPQMSVAVRMGKAGNGYLKRRIPEFVRLSRSIPVLLLTDLDHVDCAPTLLHSWLGNRPRPSGLLLRVVVCEIESWLMADRAAFAEFSGIPSSRLPARPDAIPDPKTSMLTLVRRFGRRALQRELLPGAVSTAKRGYGYNPALCAFVRDTWSPARAAHNSPSLERARSRIAELGPSAFTA